MKTESLKIRDIQYPVLSRLPNHCRVILQSHYQGRGGWAKYAIYSKSGYMLALTNKESNIRDARRMALQSLNDELRQVALIHEHPTVAQFRKVIRKYQ